MASKILKDFREYWDGWHEDWLKFSKKPNVNKRKIKNWPLPIIKLDDLELNELEKIELHKDPDIVGKDTPADKKKKFRERIGDEYKSVRKFEKFAKTEYKGHGVIQNKELDVYKAFPEPYWISKKVLNEEIKPKVVFININPAQAHYYHIYYSSKTDHASDYGPDQNENRDKGLDPKDWIEQYDLTKKYSDCINELIVFYKNQSKFWHYEKRLNWAKKIEDKIELDEIASFELCPWHTEKSTEIKDYWHDYEMVIDKILNPATYLAQKIENTTFGSKIFIRGKDEIWKKVFSHAGKLGWSRIDKKIIVFNGEKTIFNLDVYVNHNKKVVYALVFSGPRGMMFPKILKSTVFVEYMNHRFISISFENFLNDIEPHVQ